MRKPGDPAPNTHGSSSSSSSGASSGSGLGLGLYAFLLLGGAVAYGAYQYLQNAAAAENQQ